MAELLVELFSEEIPARMQARAADDLKRLATDAFKAAALQFSDARAFVTPRRLALSVEGLPVAQADLKEERRGPRVDAPQNADRRFPARQRHHARAMREARHRQGRVLFRRGREEGAQDRRRAGRIAAECVRRLAVAQVDALGRRRHPLGAPAAQHPLRLRRSSGDSQVRRHRGGRHHARPPLPGAQAVRGEIARRHTRTTCVRPMSCSMRPSGASPSPRTPRCSPRTKG